MGWIKPSYDGLEPPWRVGLPRRPSGMSPGVSRCPGAALRGGGLSPLLWCLVKNELLVRLNEGSVYAQGYAGDICLLAVRTFPNTVSGLIQWALHNVEFWCGGICRLIPTRPGLLHSLERGNLQGSSSPVCLERPCNVPCRSST